MSSHPARVRDAELTLIEVSGKDAGAFLHNMLTQDIQLLQNTEAKFSLLCDDKGKVLAQFIIVKFDITFFLVIHHSLADFLISYLKRYIFRNQVSFAIQENRITLYRTENSEKPKKLLQTLLDNDQLSITINEAPLEMISINLSANNKNFQNQANEITYSAWKKPLIEKGLVILTQTLSGKYLPQTLHYLTWNMVSLKKGCYPGQEIINRIENLGEIKQGLFIATSNDLVLNIGDELFDDNNHVCGQVIDIAIDRTSQIILAILEKNTSQQIKTRENKIIVFKKL